MKTTLLLLLTIPVIAFSQQFQTIHSASLSQQDYSVYFQEAYQQHPAIPHGILEAVAYGNTHIYHITHTAGEIDEMGMPKAYGVMGLTLDGKGYFSNNLVYVSSLSGVAVNDIINNPEKNILAYASAFDVVMTGVISHQLPTATLGETVFNTLAALSELPHQTNEQTFALSCQLYSYLTFLSNSDFQSQYSFSDPNFDLPTLFGKSNYNVLSSPIVTVSGNTINDGQGDIYKSLGSTPATQSIPDYSGAIWNAAASCNYSTRSQAVTAVVIHDVEGTYASCISWFQNCSAQVSAHYVVRSSDGQITQMVLEANKAWHVGSENGYTIGIEHEGYQAQTGWYTTAMYQSSANLVKDICNSGYGINPTTCYNGVACSGTCLKPATYKIKGHQMYPNQTHDDPGPNWNWGLYYNLINNTSSSCGTPSGLSVSLVTATSATLNWTAVSGATSYNVQYKQSSSSSWTTVTSTTTSKSISGLSASTSYGFQVQAVCNSAGSYSSATSFTTTSSSGSNDDCTNAQQLTPNTTCVTTAGNIAGATPGGLPKASCDASGSPALRDVWFKFQATAALAAIKVTPSASMDAVLSLYSSCSGGQLGCSDNGGGPGGIETINATGLTVGSTYYIRVYSYGSAVPATTTFNICITAPSSSSCGTPTALATTGITTSGATLSWSSIFSATSYNVQYKATSASTWTTVTSTTTSLTIAGLTSATGYEFQVQAVCTSTGSYSSPASFTTTTTSGSNDDCSNAQVLIPNTTCVSTTGTVAGATVSGLPKASCDAYSGAGNLEDVWFKFQATATSHTIKVSPSASFDAVLSLYTSCSGGQIGCSDNGGGQGNAETINATGLTVGNTYYVRVYGYGSTAPATPGFTICVTAPNTNNNSTVNCDVTLETTIEGFKVYKHNPSGAILFRAKMAIDADGSPRAYGPNNTGLDFTANAGSTGNWWGVVTNSNGNPIVQGSGDPYPGMYVSTTSLINSSYASTNPLRYVNSETVPFIVLPSAVTSLGGITLGDIVYVYNTTNGQGCYAVFADGGPAGKLGEGSIDLANQLGINSNARTGGTSSAIVDYIVFPHSGSGQGTIPSVATINSVGTTNINSVGGTGITSCIPSQSNLLGVDEKAADATGSTLDVYPNPFDGTTLYGKFVSTDTKKLNVAIYDIVGREILTREIIAQDGVFSISFDETALKSGVYLMVGTSNDGSRFTKRVVVKK